MKMKRLFCMALLFALMTVMMGAQAAQIERAWMEYEDYSGARAEQSIEDAKTLKELEAILTRARKNPTELNGSTVNCTLFVMTDGGDILDFACATDGFPYIQSRDNNKVYTLGLDYERFWQIFSEIKEGMGVDADSVFNW